MNNGHNGNDIEERLAAGNTVSLNNPSVGDKLDPAFALADRGTLSAPGADALSWVFTLLADTTEPLIAWLQLLTVEGPLKVIAERFLDTLLSDTVAMTLALPTPLLENQP